MRDGQDGMSLGIPSASWLVPFLLLLVRERGSCGHELTQRVADLDSGTMRPGMVYQALRQMESEGIVLSEPDRLDCGLLRRKYWITGSGEAYLELWANSLTEYQKEVDLFFGAYAGGPMRQALG